MQKPRFSNIGTYNKLGSIPRNKKGLFEKIRSFFWNYPNFFLPSIFKFFKKFRNWYIKTRPLTPILLVLLFLSLVIVGTYYGSTIKRAKKRELLIEGVLGVPTNFNAVYLPTFQVQKDVYQLVFDRLFKVLPDGNQVGELVDSWEYKEEGKELHIKLRPSVFWHDGEPFTASDVKFTLELYKNLPGQDSYYDTVSDVEVEIISDMELVFKKSRTSSSFIETITWPILPEHILKEAGEHKALDEDLNDNLIGTGPFKFSSLSKDSIQLERNDNYWKDVPKLKNIVFKSYPSEKLLLHALEAGKIDATTEINALNVELLSGVPWLRFESVTLLRRYWSVYFNFNGPEIFKDKQIRQAVSSSINREQIINEALFGYAIEAKGPIRENSWAFNSDTKRYTYDIEESRKLFTERGYVIPEGETYMKKDDSILEFELAYVSNPIQDEVAQIILQNLEDIGVKVNLVGLSYREFRDTRLLSRNFDAILFGVESLLDPDHFILWHSSQATPPGRNFSSYVSGYKVIENITRVDDALEKGKSILDKDQRKDLYMRFQTYLLDEVPAAFLYHPKFIYTHNKTLSGIDLGEVTLVEERFDDIEKWYFE